MPTPTWNRALVTGASSGIGTSFARLLAAEGVDLVLVARSTDKLESLAEELREAAGVDVEVLTADLSVEAEVDRVAERVASRTAPVDLLVNNAGHGLTGPFHELDADAQDAMVRLNVGAVMALAHAAIEPMTERGGGGILNVGSMTAYTPIPTWAAYAATKSFVLSFSEALHEELRGRGIHVTCLNPGFTRTEFQDAADFDSRQIPGPLWMDAEPVARAGLDGVARNRAVVVPGAPNQVSAALTRLIPSAVLRKGTQLAMSVRSN